MFLLISTMSNAALLDNLLLTNPGLHLVYNQQGRLAIETRKLRSKKYREKQPYPFSIVKWLTCQWKGMSWSDCFHYICTYSSSSLYVNVRFMFEKYILLSNHIVLYIHVNNNTSEIISTPARPSVICNENFIWKLCKNACQVGFTLNMKYVLLWITNISRHN